MCDRQECELKIKVITKSDEEPYITGIGGTMATGLSTQFNPPKIKLVAGFVAGLYKNIIIIPNIQF